LQVRRPEAPAHAEEEAGGEEAGVGPLELAELLGSSKELHEAIDQFGHAASERRILQFCPSQRVLSYAEAREQFARDVLTARLPDVTREYYNANILARWFAPAEPDHLSPP